MIKKVTAVLIILFIFISLLCTKTFRPYFYNYITVFIKFNSKFKYY